MDDQHLAANHLATPLVFFAAIWYLHDPAKANEVWTGCVRRGEGGEGGILTAGCMRYDWWCIQDGLCTYRSRHTSWKLICNVTQLLSQSPPRTSLRRFTERGHEQYRGGGGLCWFYKQLSIIIMRLAHAYEKYMQISMLHALAKVWQMMQTLPAQGSLFKLQIVLFFFYTPAYGRGLRRCSAQVFGEEWESDVTA